MNKAYESERVIRGGGWANIAVYCRSAYRGYDSPSLRYYAHGFRLVRTSRNVDPKGPESGSYRVIRGGGWANSAVNCRSAYRNYASPSSRYGALGFRLVRTSRSTLSSHTLTLSRMRP